MNQNEPKKLNKRRVTEEFSAEAFSCICNTCLCTGGVAFATDNFRIHNWPHMN